MWFGTSWKELGVRLFGFKSLRNHPGKTFVEQGGKTLMEIVVLARDYRIFIHGEEQVSMIITVITTAPWFFLTLSWNCLSRVRLPKMTFKQVDIKSHISFLESWNTLSPRMDDESSCETPLSKYKKL